MEAILQATHYSTGCANCAEQKNCHPRWLSCKTSTAKLLEASSCWLYLIQQSTTLPLFQYSLSMHTMQQPVEGWSCLGYEVSQSWWPQDYIHVQGIVIKSPGLAWYYRLDHVQASWRNSLENLKQYKRKMKHMSYCKTQDGTISQWGLVKINDKSKRSSYMWDIKFSKGI